MTSTRLNQLWVSRKAKRLSRRKKRAYHRANTTGSEADKSHYVQACKDTRHACKRAYNSYISDMVTSARNPKKLYSLVKGKRCDSSGISPLKSDGVAHSDRTTKASILIDQLCSVFTIEETSGIPSLGDCPYPDMSSFTIGVEGVRKLQADLGPHKATGPDNIPTKLLKDYAQGLAQSPTLLCTGMQHAGPQPPGRTSGVKTGSLQQTTNYIWNTADALGRGATAIVYFGRHKDIGDVCAVKVFHRGWRGQSSSQQREIEALKSVQHENIVKFLALEKETTTESEVLVMEYCSGGSVYTMLEQPQYAYGFPVSEFMLFLLHLAQGMQFLRSRGYIHRDIKPGNIMRAIGEDGRSLYKITDFGAARPLDDDETFMSIYGTEEYLFPGMYERAVLRQAGPGNQQFDASVDIWSLGVTIYHVGTGQLPFRPYGGRSNAATMHHITSSKPSGAISGIQENPHGIIKWSKRLPDTCRLPQSLQDFLARMLAGLLETNPALMWSFEKYFDNVNELNNTVTIKVFVVGFGKTLELYVNRSATWANIEALIASESEHPVIDQLILCHDKDVKTLVDQSAAAHTYPRHVLGETWVLVNKQSTEGSSLSVCRPPEFPAISSSENLDIDAQTSKQCSATAHQYFLYVQTNLDQQHMLGTAELCYRQYVKIVVRDFEVVLPQLRLVLQETRRRQESFKSAFKVVMSLFNTITCLTNTDVLTFSKSETKCQLMDCIQQLDAFLEDDTLERFFQKIQTRLSEIEVYVEVLSRKIFEQETERLKARIGCQEDEHCHTKMENMKTKIAAISTTMIKHKKYKDLHTHEQFIHKCEKEKLQEYCVSMVSLANEHCNRNLHICHKHAIKEIGNLTKHLVRTQKVEQNIAAVKDSLEQLGTKLETEEDQCKTFVERISGLLASTLTRGSCQSDATSSSFNRRPPGSAVSMRRTVEGAESHQTVEETRGQSSSVENEDMSKPKKQRTVLLDKLTQELGYLQRDSEELKHLVTENSVVMKKFLTETSNLRIDGSLDSDTRPCPPEDVKHDRSGTVPQAGTAF